MLPRRLVARHGVGRVCFLSTKAAEGGKDAKKKFGYQPGELKAYKQQMRELRRRWRDEEAARR